MLVLKYSESPFEWLKAKGITTPNYFSGGQITIFNLAFPELLKNQEFAKRIVTDLFDRGLAHDWQSMLIEQSGGGMTAPRITLLGRQFLAFIASPIKEI